MNLNMTIGQTLANYCVDILKAVWLPPAFVESYRLLCVTLSKEIVALHV